MSGGRSSWPKDSSENWGDVSRAARRTHFELEINQDGGLAGAGGLTFLWNGEWESENAIEDSHE